MARRMACSLTVGSVEAGVKTVTRRHPDTWAAIRPGQMLTLIEKGMGLPKGSTQRVLADVQVVANDVVALGDITQAECIAEGFPDLGPAEFIEMWCRSHGIPFGSPELASAAAALPVRRIEWAYFELATLVSTHEDGDVHRTTLRPGIPDTMQNRQHVILDQPARLPEGRWTHTFETKLPPPVVRHALPAGMMPGHLMRRRAD